MRRFDRVQTRTATPDETREARNVPLRLDGFAWEAIDQEAAREGLTVQELVSFAVLYYLADSDSGRIARQVARSPLARPTGTPR